MNRRYLLLCVFALAYVSCGSSVSSNSGQPSNPAGPPGSSGTSSITISTATLPVATTSVGYRANLAASGGTAPYRWSVASGNLPAGLLLDGPLGTLTGTPSAAQAASLELQVQDAAGQKVTKSFTLTVEAANWATTYYVDSVSGKDSNSGTSQSAPWKTIAKVNASSFAPGDRILFKRGDIWREQLAIPSSGLPGATILFDAYGSGAAPVISGADLVVPSAWTICSGCSSNIWEAPVSTQPNVVLFNGTKGKKESSTSQLTAANEWYWSGGKLYIWSSGNPATSLVNPGIEAGSRQLAVGMFGISFVTVQNLQASAANGLPTNAAVYAQSSSTGSSSHDLTLNQLTVTQGAADGIHLEDCNNCIVQNSTVAGMSRAGIMLVNNHPQYPVTAAAVLGNTVSSNEFDGISTYGCAVGASCEGQVLSKGQFLTGLIISGNLSHDNGAGIYLRWTNNSSVTANSSYSNNDTTAGGEGYGIGMEASSNNTLAMNLLYSNRTRGIELSNDSGAGAALTGASNNRIEYNAIHDNGDHGLFTNASPTQANQFLYNVVWNHPNGECFLANGTGHVFYGNTCWNNSTAVDLYTSSSSPTTANITIKNNIFAKNVIRGVHLESGVSTTTIVMDYNDYDHDAPALFLWRNGSGDMKAWQGQGFDGHSIVADPQFVSSSPSSPGDFALQPNSPAAAGGTSLGAGFSMGLNPASTWPSGVQSASQGTAWSMGAFPQGP